MKAIVVDDERLARHKLARFLAGEPDIEVAAECASGPEALAALRRLRPDLLFLDVQMPGMSGLDVLRAAGPDAAGAIVFVTAHDEHALAAFEAAAVDYLLKPFDQPRFRRAVERARRFADAGRVAALLERIAAPEPRLAVRDADRTVFVPASAILWLEAADNYVVVHTGQGEHLIRDTLTRLEARLDPGRFVRAHRSAIVRLSAVAEVRTLFHGGEELRLVDGTVVPVGRSCRDRVRAVLGGG